MNMLPTTTSTNPEIFICGSCGKQYYSCGAFIQGTHKFCCLTCIMVFDEKETRENLIHMREDNEKESNMSFL